MSEDVARLQDLLARVQRNAALPRILNVADGAAPTLPEPPAYFAAPAAAAPSAALDDSVDELLLEDPFPSAPPPPPSYNELLEEEPIPLMSRSAHQQDISGVMALAVPADEPPEELLEDDIIEVTSGSESSASPTQGLQDELNFDDEELDRDREPELELPPASSKRNRIAGTMDEALARAAEQIDLDEGREVPLKTPPPESGPQEALNLPSVAHAGLPRDIEELLEADILNQGGGHAHGGVHAAMPTAEQLGQTIDLDEARGPSLELDHPAERSPESPPGELPGEELEVNLPRREFGGGYQDDLRPPPEAQRDLEAHRERFRSLDSAPVVPPESRDQYPAEPGFASQSPAFVAAGAPAAVTTDSYSESVSTVTVGAASNAEFAPELLARPTIQPTPTAKFVRKQAARPNTFLELLDASLGLGRD